MARGRVIRPRARGARRMTSWLEIPPSETTLTGAGGTIIASLTTAEKAKLPFTIVRTHIACQVTSDQIAASETQFSALGGVVVSQQAVSELLGSFETSFILMLLN